MSGVCDHEVAGSAWQRGRELPRTVDHVTEDFIYHGGEGGYSDRASFTRSHVAVSCPCGFASTSTATGGR